MVEFSTEAILDVDVSDRSLKKTRSKIQDSIGDVTVDVTVPGGQIGGRRRGGGGGGGQMAAPGGSRNRLSRLGAATDTTNKLLTLQLEEIRDLHETVEKMAASEGGGLPLLPLAGLAGMLGGGGLKAGLAKGLKSALGRLKKFGKGA
ncbi:hypothetical protein [Haladaptatus pallidirubidus]|uniref:Uncharacterized protein n=2 Tax=Haladaptatus pallidirubidus TaxID=1008152 RepID=A0AAV3UBM6_9EURY|nr:hypothetical protein [Haladaptatus pallidirubidus]